MTAAQFELLDIDQATKLLQYRFQRLTEAGHDAVRALMLAVRPDLDLRLASDLLAVADEFKRR